jgi:hypothetical protein
VAEGVVGAAVAAGRTGGSGGVHAPDPSDSYLTSARWIRQIPIASGTTSQMNPLTAR